ncbi:aminoglycoside phosphotransferase family protein [Histidinibacterium lentulum]|uniref:Aminoglycoside phosphotransferase n=1 Tax=Histidinibacterium lentulum TaxID=2480588 RepID=A0A3N2R730_9RHOB|nr:phosphotransferase [Histidinibacterium lentulum]ROU03181.1 aminoglycoside phosphotransferase [Histidinibacterium lentulum]
MSDRACLLADVLSSAGYADWQVTPLPADASRRRYLRLRRGAETRIVMDAPPEAVESLDAFLRVGAHLRSLGLAAPDVLHADTRHGILILEDLGPTQAARHLDNHPGDEAEIYETAAALLAALQSAPPPAGLSTLVPATAAAMLAPFFAHAVPDPDRRDAIAGTLEAAMTDHAAGPMILSLRDFHAENLIWRPDRRGTDRLGLLDFQDAFLAPPAYDLASLLDDVRRDVSPATGARTLDAFARLTQTSPESLAAARAVLSVQRNLRILGVFAALIAGGKPRYRAFLPRLRRHLQRQLALPALGAVRPHVLPILASETPWT